MLIDVVKSSVAALRQSDLMGRLGGEEFAVLLPHTALKDAEQIAEKLRRCLEALHFSFGGTPLSVTGSYGVAEMTAEGDIDGLIEDADQALYDAKAAGRNCVAAHGKPVLQILPGRRVLKGGKIVFNRNTSVVDCTVRSLSANGARLDVSTTVGLPGEFELRILSEKFTSRCRTVAQTDRHLDVAFC